LAKYDWQVTIIASSVDHVTGRQRINDDKSSLYQIINEIPFLWINTPKYSGNGFARILNMLAYAVKVLKRNSTSGLSAPNVVIGSSVHPFAALAAALLAWRFNVPFIFEVRDLWPQTLIDFGRLKNKSIIATVLKSLELWLYKRASMIIVLLPNAWEYIVPLGISKEKIKWIPNGVDLNLFDIDDNYIYSEFFTIMYFGSHAKSDGIDLMLMAMYELQNSNNSKHIRLRLIGEGPEKLNLIMMAKDLKLNNVSFESSIPKNMIPKTASEADAFVIALLDLPNLYKYGVSMNKIFDYLAASRPIIISSNAINNPVVEAGAGVAVEAGNSLALAKAFLDLSQTGLNKRIEMGRSGREYVKKFHDFHELAGRFSIVLNDLIKFRG
jgi:glycosyltransferase involved in cell wall biosynthesis